MNLSKDHGDERLEGACHRALTIGCPTGKRIKMIHIAKLDQRPDMFPAAESAAPAAIRSHANVRGTEYSRCKSTMTYETIQPTLDKLNALKLAGMAIALSDQMTQGAAQGLVFEERLALLLDRESLYRENQRMMRLEQLAQFKQRAALEDLNYRDRTGQSLRKAHVIQSGHFDSKPVAPAAHHQVATQAASGAIRTL